MFVLVYEGDTRLGKTRLQKEMAGLTVPVGRFWVGTHLGAPGIKDGTGNTAFDTRINFHRLRQFALNTGYGMRISLTVREKRALNGNGVNAQTVWFNRPTFAKWGPAR